MMRSVPVSPPPLRIFIARNDFRANGHLPQRKLIALTRENFKARSKPSLNRFTLKILIVASGKEYQHAAALAASTFAVHLPTDGSVSVMLPGKEGPSPL